MTDQHNPWAGPDGLKAIEKTVDKLYVKAYEGGVSSKAISEAKIGKGVFQRGQTVEVNGSQFCVTRIENRKSGGYLTLKLLPKEELL